MNIGRRNIAVGAGVLIVGALGGLALGFTVDPFFEKGFYAIPLTRFLVKAGHSHGMPFALLNLIVGSTIDRLTLSERWMRRCSSLAIASLLMPIGLILRGIDGGQMRFAPVVAVGALSFMTAAALLIKGSAKSQP